MINSPTKTAKTVVSCYDLLDLAATGGIEDYTEGVYGRDLNKPYIDAQRAQANYLLNEIKCGEGSHILDIGCGNGALLQAACERGATGIGITISKPQVKRCRRRGLAVHLMNYRDIPKVVEWQGTFDSIIANGSVEHFVQPQDAIEGKQDETYRELFKICHKILNSSSKSKRIATTIIHFNRKPDPEDLLKSPFSFKWGSDPFHYSILQKAFGGYYPSDGQLEHCAQGLFDLEKEVDGTHDYYLTSEEWLKQFKKSLFFNPWFTARLVGKMIIRPFHTSAMLACLAGAESWAWQFRTENPPTQLLRQTWKLRD